MRLPALGVKPEVWERWTLYLATPTLSVDADQARMALPMLVVAARPAGAVGGWLSSLGAGKRTMAATDGTPLLSTRKSMYGPGGAMLPFAGAVTVSEPLPATKVRGTKRW